MKSSSRLNSGCAKMVFSSEPKYSSSSRRLKYKGLIPSRSRARTNRLASCDQTAMANMPRKRAQDYFGVTVGFEFFAARFEFCAQFPVIVDLAVENQDSITVLTDHGLIAGLK